MTDHSAISMNDSGGPAAPRDPEYLHEGDPTPEAVIDPPVDFASLSYRDMIAKSLLNRGNNKRLKAAIEKAKRGELR